jgi:hypothetical protein
MAAKEKKGRIHNRKYVKITHGIGFIAYYRDEEIAFAKDFGVLVGNSLVKARMGNRDLIIKHTVKARGVVHFHSGREAAEQWFKEGKYALPGGLFFSWLRWRRIESHLRPSWSG